jgi:hypothetical protein
MAVETVMRRRVLLGSMLIGVAAIFIPFKTGIAGHEPPAKAGGL